MMMNVLKVNQSNKFFIWITYILIFNSNVSFSSTKKFIGINFNDFKVKSECKNFVWIQTNRYLVNTDIYINENYFTDISGSFTCKNLILKDNVTLTIRTGDYVEVLEEIIAPNTSKIIIEKGGHLVQRCVECKNSYQIIHEHETTLLKNHEYAYWSSPIKENIIQQLTNAGLGRMYYWQSGSGGGWRNLTSTGTISSGGIGAGRGFIAGNPPNDAQKFNVKFTGIANTGKILFPVTIQDNSSDNPNNFILVGNPYPSTINLVDFITHPINQFLDGAVYFWKNTNYVHWNLSGSTRTVLQTNDSDGLSNESTKYAPSFRFVSYKKELILI